MPRGEPKPLHQIHPATTSPPPFSFMLITIIWGYTNPKRGKFSHSIPSLILWISGHGFWFSLSPPLRSIYLSWPSNFPFWFRPLPLLSQTKRSQRTQEFFGKGLTLLSADRWYPGQPEGWQCQASPTPQRASPRVMQPKARAPFLPMMAAMPVIGAWSPMSAHPVLAVYPGGKNVRSVRMS